MKTASNIRRKEQKKIVRPKILFTEQMYDTDSGLTRNFRTEKYIFRTQNFDKAFSKLNQLFYHLLWFLSILQKALLE